MQVTLVETCEQPNEQVPLCFPPFALDNLDPPPPASVCVVLCPPAAVAVAGPDVLTPAVCSRATTCAWCRTRHGRRHSRHAGVCTVPNIFCQRLAGVLYLLPVTCWRCNQHRGHDGARGTWQPTLGWRVTFHIGRVLALHCDAVFAPVQAFDAH